MPALQSYVLVSQRQRRLEVYQRQQDGSWQYEVLEKEDALELPCINLSITLDEIYELVVFNDGE